MEDFSLEIEDRGPSGALIVARGELSIMSAPGLAVEIGALVSRGVRRVVLDLGEVVFADSTGLGFLLNGLRRLSRVGGQLVLVVPPGHVHRVFEMTRLDGVFHLMDTRAQALGELGLAAVGAEG
ncbi:unannotated protein [freshwater metagenome]|jgi:anti-anti-sigma factor|uniref:Unannotated protein n=1 Tax=freshwater metagenome TaxID=449393 RepID=A0A6J7J5N9_9ZZZZ|nr:anti-sigma factor antagonist [Actinomycetota bacterium]